MDEAIVAAVLRRAEWAWSAPGGFCPWCYQLKSDGHADDCKLAALLAEDAGLPTIDLTPEHTAEALTVAPSTGQGVVMVADLLKLFNLFAVPEDVELYGDAELYACDPLDPDRRFVIRRVRLAKGAAGEGGASE